MNLPPLPAGKRFTLPRPPLSADALLLAQLAAREKGAGRATAVFTADANDAQRLIDELNEVVGPLANFLLPGGSPGASAIHVARTICRRAERAVTTLARDEPIGPTVLPYLNRLSDALFVMARYENHERGVDEPLWSPGR